MNYKTDVAIIGAGPVGLFAIFECGMLKLKCHVIDALDMIGGQCAALYPEKPIYDIPGFSSIDAGKLIENLKEQASPFHPTYHLNQKVTRIEPLNDQGSSWRLETNAGTILEAKVIIIAAGVGAFGPNRPPLEDLKAYEKTGGVQYYVSSREAYRGKKIVIAGGGDSAVDWALSLSEVAQKVSVVHRRAKFRAAPESASRLQELASKGIIEMVVPYQLSGLQGEEGHLQSVLVKTLEGEEKALEADHLLAFFGLSMNLGPIAEWGLGLEHNHIKVDPTTSLTSRSGIYAIGDIAQYPNKLKLILTGFADAAQAAHHIRSFLYPDEVLHFEYSTTKGVPGDQESVKVS